MAKVDCKVVLLGRHSVGKTSLVDRYLNGEYNPKSTATIGAAFSARQVTVGNESVTLGIWDTAGAERYESMSRIYYRSAKAALICFDLTDADSVKLWVKELTDSEPQCQLYVVGTKLDALGNGSERGVDALAARNFATQHGARYHETSSLSGRGVAELFADVAERYLDQLQQQSQQLHQQQQQQQQNVQRRAAANNVRLDGANKGGARRRKKQGEGGCCE